MMAGNLFGMEHSELGLGEGAERIDGSWAQGITRLPNLRHSLQYQLPGALQSPVARIYRRSTRTVIECRSCR